MSTLLHSDVARAKHKNFFMMIPVFAGAANHKLVVGSLPIATHAQ